jgi:hypothetical protein
MFLRLRHVHAHVTPPHSSLPEKCSSRAHETAKTTKTARTTLYIYAILRKQEPTNQLHLRTTIDKQALAHVIQLSSNHSSKNTLLIRSKPNV